jgi:hypothetical protein
MKTIRFSPSGTPISDFEIDTFVDKIFSTDKDETYEISTHIVIDEIRARVNEKKIDLNNLTIEIWEKGIYHNFPIDKDGRSPDWYPCQEIWENIAIRLV